MKDSMRDQLEASIFMDNQLYGDTTVLYSLLELLDDKIIFNALSDEAQKDFPEMLDLDAEDDPDYQIVADYEDIISNAPECVTRYFRELSLKKQLEFIQMNPEADCDGSFQFTDEVVLERLDEPLLGKQGKPSSCKSIVLSLSIDEYILTYSKFGYVISSEVFDIEEDGDEAFTKLAKDHPECKKYKL